MTGTRWPPSCMRMMAAVWSFTLLMASAIPRECFAWVPALAGACCFFLLPRRGFPNTMKLRWGPEGLAGTIVTLDFAVTQTNDAMSMRGDIGLVSDQDNRVAFGVQLGEKSHDFLAGLRVQ